MYTRAVTLISECRLQHSDARYAAVVTSEDHGYALGRDLDGVYVARLPRPYGQPPWGRVRDGAGSFNVRKDRDSEPWRYRDAARRYAPRRAKGHVTACSYGTSRYAPTARHRHRRGLADRHMWIRYTRHGKMVTSWIRQGAVHHTAEQGGHVTDKVDTSQGAQIDDPVQYKAEPAHGQYSSREQYQLAA
eukprot:291250-Rhodomonas_salina.1